MKLLEALADSIWRFEGWIPPGVDPKFPQGSRSWRNRNPGNLRPAFPLQPVPGQIGKSLQPVSVDDRNYRIFDSLAQGWIALLNDISAKLEGSHGLTDNSTLRNFFDIYAPSDDDNDPNKYARQVAIWLSRDLGSTIAPETTLGQLKQLG
jgi:hypothetical protein